LEDKSLLKRKEREKERKRSEIMDAAEKLFAERGFINIKMEDIAREAEFTRKTLYSYFTNKDDLFREVFLRFSILRWDFLAEKILLAEDGIPRIRAFGQANYEYTMANPEHFKLMFYIDHQGTKFIPYNSDFDMKLLEGRKEIMRILEEAYVFGQLNQTIRSDLNIKRNQIHLSITLRSILNEIVLGYEDRDFYFDYLELFLRAIQP